MNRRNHGSTKGKAPITVFVASVVVIFFLSLSAADSVGFVPCQIDGSCVADSVSLADLPQLGVESATSTTGVLPTHIAIPAAGIDLPVQNPATRNVDTLDALLKNGPARYVDSAELGQKGNVLIFAHSSHLPIVTNKMFQAFNNIPNLKMGDTITLTGADGSEYLYSVKSVVRTDTTDGTKISLKSTSTRELTLVTCDTLTGKSARFVLTASYVGKIQQGS